MRGHRIEGLEGREGSDIELEFTGVNVDLGHGRVGADFTS